MDDRGLNTCTSNFRTFSPGDRVLFAPIPEVRVSCWKTIELSTKDFTIASVNAFLEWRLVSSKSSEREP
ncbi:unnamed protein product, partial [Nesidiocoris tenuis]